MRAMTFTGTMAELVAETTAYNNNHTGTMEPLRTIHVFAPVRRNARSGYEWVDRQCVRPSISEVQTALDDRAVEMDCDMFTRNNPCVRIERFVLVADRNGE